LKAGVNVLTASITVSHV